MKRYSIQIAVLFAIFFSSAMLALNIMAETHQMACRGGGEMQGYLNAAGERTILIIDFRKASDPNNLQPGECSWVDRPINDNEPSTLTYSISTASIRAIVSSGRVEFQLNTNKNLQVLLDAIQNGKTFYVYCDNVGDTFRITKVGL